MKLLRAAGLFGLAGATLALAGCSVSETGNLGLTVHNDHVEALVVMCPDVTSNALTLQKYDNGIIRWFDPKWTFPATSSTTVDLGSMTRFLKVLGSRGDLVAAASNGVGGALDASPEALRNLAEGEVLSANGSSETSVEDRATFEKKTAELCNRYP